VPPPSAIAVFKAMRLSEGLRSTGGMPPFSSGGKNENGENRHQQYQQYQHHRLPPPELPRLQRLLLADESMRETLATCTAIQKTLTNRQFSDGSRTQVTLTKYKNADSSTMVTDMLSRWDLELEADNCDFLVAAVIAEVMHVDCPLHTLAMGHRVRKMHDDGHMYIDSKDPNDIINWPEEQFKREMIQSYFYKSPDRQNILAIFNAVQCRSSTVLALDEYFGAFEEAHRNVRTHGLSDHYSPAAIAQKFYTGLPSLVKRYHQS